MLAILFANLFAPLFDYLVVQANIKRRRSRTVKFNKDSVGGTISIVVLLSLACSVIVAGSAVLLKPTQEEQKQLDKQKNILSVAGLLQKDTKPVKLKIFLLRILKLVVELN